MSNYRRYRVPGGCTFFTVNLLERHPNDLLVHHVDLLRASDAHRYARHAVNATPGNGASGSMSSGMSGITPRIWITRITTRSGMDMPRVSRGILPDWGGVGTREATVRGTHPAIPFSTTC